MMSLARALLGGLLPVLLASAATAQDSATDIQLMQGDRERGRLVFAPCRTCHFTVAAAGHGNGPNLYRIFGKVAGKQPGFEYYSPLLSEAEFVWTPRVMYAWLENPMAATPGTSMMCAGIPDPGQRADLIAYLQWVTMQEAAD
jgi:cytochrome c